MQIKELVQPKHEEVPSHIIEYASETILQKYFDEGVDTLVARGSFDSKKGNKLLKIFSRSQVNTLEISESTDKKTFKIFSEINSYNFHVCNSYNNLVLRSLYKVIKARVLKSPSFELTLYSLTVKGYKLLVKFVKYLQSVPLAKLSLRMERETYNIDYSKLGKALAKTNLTNFRSSIHPDTSKTGILHSILKPRILIYMERITLAQKFIFSDNFKPWMISLFSKFNCTLETLESFYTRGSLGNLHLALILTISRIHLFVSSMTYDHSFLKERTIFKVLLSKRNIMPSLNSTKLDMFE